MVCCWWVIAVTFLFLHVASQRFRYYLRVLLAYVIIQIAGLIALPGALISPGNKNILVFSSWQDYLAALVYDLNYDISGLEHIGNEAAIVVVNHRSSLDSVVLSRLGRNLGTASFVAKRELLKFLGFAGLVWYLSDMVFVDRRSIHAARDSLEVAKKQMLEQKMKVIVFPEGTRNKDNTTLLPFKKGFFFLAVQAQVPILPIVISDYSDFYCPFTPKWERGGKVKVTILPQVSTKGMTDENVPELSESVRKNMLTVYEKTVIQS